MFIGSNGLFGKAARWIGNTVPNGFNNIIQRCISYFNGTDAYAVSTARIIDLDAPDPSFIITLYNNLSNSGSPFNQYISATDADKEFDLIFGASVSIILGGTTTVLLADTSSYTEYDDYTVNYDDGTGNLILSNSAGVISTTAVTIGASREPTAKARYMYLQDGYLKGVTIEHNNKTVTLPMSECNKDLNDELFYWNETAPVDSRFWLKLNGTSVSQINTNGVNLTTKFAVKMTCELSTDASLFGYDSATFYARLVGSDRISIYDGESFGVSGFYSGDLKVGFHDYYIFVNESDRVEIIIDGQNLGTVNTRTFTGFMEFLIGAHNSTIRHINGGVKSFEMWTDGTDITGTKIIDYHCDDYSNVIVNHANPLGANVWDDASTVLTGDTAKSGTQYTMTTATSSVYDVEASSTGLGYLCFVTLVSGDIQELEGGLSGVQNTGWSNVRDSKNQPVLNQFYTLVNNTTNDNLTLTKTGSSELVIKDVQFKRAIDYGVLNGTRNTDYEWLNDGCHAVGYNVETENLANAITDENGDYIYDESGMIITFEG